MSEIGSGNGSSYPGSIDTNSVAEVNSPNAGRTRARKEVVEDLSAAVIAIENELGTDPAGSLSNVKTYLQTEHQVDGTHKSSHGPHVYIDEANYANFSAAVAAAANKTLVVGRSINLDANTIIAASTSIMPINPGVINANGFTLTIIGPVVGDPKHQWLSGFSAGVIFSNATTNIYPEWFGAVGDATITDDTIPVQSTLFSMGSTQILKLTKLFRINGNLIYTNYYLIIEGTNKRYTGFRFYGTGVMFTVSSDVPTSLPFNLVNFTIINNNLIAGQTAIKFTDGNHSSIIFKHMSIHGFTAAAIEKLGGIDDRYMNSTFDVGINGIGIYYSGGPITTLYIKECLFLGQGHSGQAIKCLHAEGGSVITENIFESFIDSNPLMDFYDNAGNTISLFICNNYFEDNQNQLSYVHIPNGQMITFSNNYVSIPSNSPDYILDIGDNTDVRNVDIVDNLFTNFAASISYFRFRVIDLNLKNNYYSAGGTKITTTDNYYINRYRIDEVATGIINDENNNLISLQNFIVDANRFMGVTNGGSTTISSGDGVLKMSTANSATNAAWIPMKYNGIIYYIPGFITNIP